MVVCHGAEQPRGELPLRGVKFVERESETVFTVTMQTGDWEAEREPFKLRPRTWGSQAVAEAATWVTLLRQHCPNLLDRAAVDAAATAAAAQAQQAAAAPIINAVPQAAAYCHCAACARVCVCMRSMTDEG